MKTALIILNYNNYEETIDCVESVQKHNSAPIKYIIVDNGSTRMNSVQSLDTYFNTRFYGNYKRFNYEENIIMESLPFVSFIVSTKNDGYACGNNKGLKYAYADVECDQVLILNNDILFVEDIIPDLSKILKQTDNAAIICPLLLKKDKSTIDYNCARKAPSIWNVILPYLFFYKNFLGLIDKIKEDRLLLKKYPSMIQQDICPIDLPSGACMLLNKQLMQNIGGFDSHTFLYFEENILYKKIKELNKKNYIIPRLKCIHLGASSTKQKGSAFTLNASIESARYYINKYESPSFIQKIAMKIAYYNMKLKIFFIKLIKK